MRIIATIISIVEFSTLVFNNEIINSTDEIVCAKTKTKPNARQITFDDFFEVGSIISLLY